MPPRSPARPWQYLLLAALLAVAGAYQVGSTYELVRLRLSGDRIAREPLWLRFLTDEVGGVQPEAAAAGVRVGDRLVAVAGRPYDGRRVLTRAVAARGSGDTIRLAIAAPDGAVREATVRLVAGPPATSTNTALDLLLGVAMPLLCLALGFGAAALRPWDRQAWLLLFLLLGIANFAGVASGQAGWGDLVRVPTLAYQGFFSTAWPLGVLLFGLFFPERLPFDRKLPWLKWLLVVPLGAHSVLAATAAVASSESWAWWPVLRAPLAVVRPWLSVLYTLAVAGGFAALGVKAGAASDPDVRRRLRLVTWGGQVGLGPIGVLAVAAILLRRSLFDVGPPLLGFAALLLVPVFPAVLAYVVVVHRALDLRTTIRQGLQYALARGGIRALQIGGSAIVILVATGLVADPSVNRPQRISLLALGIGFVFAARALAARLLAFTDRRFFREAYDAERVLSELSEEVRTIPETSVLVDTVARRIADTLHVPRLALLLRGGSELSVFHAVGLAGAAEHLPADGRVASHLERERRPAFVYADDPASWLVREDVPLLERGVLSRLHSQLLLPLAVKETLVGVLSLGPKLSEEAYSPSDVRLLASLAGQTALALENARLTRAVADEAAKRARMTREIEIAREVQESLYPQERPLIAGLDFAGRCRPARGVGGDYFDFRALAGGALSVAIGDVSGKGVPAALLMASLQASIRGQELAGSDRLGSLMANVNRLVYESSPANRYATLFYGRFDPVERRLRYVNAGHNAPMLFRADGSLERLETGGPVAGLIAGAGYDEGAVRLGARDALVLYTDGISEAMNPAGEEWGEQRLAEAVRRAAGTSAGELIDTLFGEADRFAGSAEQYDDMTLVVLRATA